MCQGRQVPLAFGHGQDRGVVVHDAGHVTGPAPWGHHDRRDPEPVLREPGISRRRPVRPDVIRRDRRRWRQVVVVAAAFIKGPYQQRARPGRGVHDRLDDGGGEHLGVHNVLRVLPGVGAPVGVDDRKTRKAV